jgi:hypothetical protein
MAKLIHQFTPRQDAVLCGATGKLDASTDATEVDCRKCAKRRDTLRENFLGLHKLGYLCGTVGNVQIGRKKAEKRREQVSVKRRRK